MTRNRLIAAAVLTLACAIAIVLWMHDKPATTNHPAIVLPATSGTPTHLAVLLHGVGADAQGFADIGRALAPAFPDVEFLVPDGFHPFDGGPTGHQWFSIRGVTPENRFQRVRDAGTEVSAWIDDELAKRAIAKDHLILIGFSQGSIVSAWLAVNRTPQPRAVVMLSGRAAIETASSPGPVPVFLGHGDRDGVIPLEDSAQAAKTLEGFGARVTAKVYPGLAHGVDARELRDVVEFLESSI